MQHTILVTGGAGFYRLDCQKENAYQMNYIDQKQLLLFADNFKKRLW